MQDIELERETIHATSWWAVSLFAHAVAALVGLFVVVAMRIREPDAPMLIHPPGPIERPYNKSVRIPSPHPFEGNNGDLVMFTWVIPADIVNECPCGPESAFPTVNDRELPLDPSPHISTFLNHRVSAGRLQPVNFCPQRKGGGTEAAVLSALRWLARHQDADGSWSATGHCKQKMCLPSHGSEGFNVGLTGLSLLAFLGAGHTHHSKDTYDGVCFGMVVRNGLEFLMKNQDPSGRLTAEDSPKYMYGHLIAAQALIQAYGMSRSLMIKDAAQRAVDYVVRAQNPGRAWRYTFRSGDNDASVTGWAAQLLRWAQVAELAFPKETTKAALSWMDSVTRSDYFITGYAEPGRAPAELPTPTAIGIMTRMLLNKNKSDPKIRAGAEWVIVHPPEPDKIDFYFWYFGSLAMVLFDGPSGPYWKRWNEKLRRALVDKQNQGKDCKDGSWEPVDRWSSEGGRVYTTAMGALILETRDRYLNYFYFR